MLPGLLSVCPSGLFRGDLFSTTVPWALGGRSDQPPGWWLLSLLGVLATGWQRDHFPGTLRRHRPALNCHGSYFAPAAQVDGQCVTPLAELVEADFPVALSPTQRAS